MTETIRGQAMLKCSQSSPIIRLHHICKAIPVWAPVLFYNIPILRIFNSKNFYLLVEIEPCPLCRGQSPVKWTESTANSAITTVLSIVVLVSSIKLDDGRKSHLEDNTNHQRDVVSWQADGRRGKTPAIICLRSQSRVEFSRKPGFLRFSARVRSNAP